MCALFYLYVCFRGATDTLACTHIEIYIHMTLLILSSICLYVHTFLISYFILISFCHIAKDNIHTYTCTHVTNNNENTLKPRKLNNNTSNGIRSQTTKKDIVNINSSNNSNNNNTMHIRTHTHSHTY